MSAFDPFASAVAAHDAELCSRRLDIWAGSEPTFTDRESTAPEWTSQALGLDKVQRAGRLLRELDARFPQGRILRTIGRQYPGEQEARWSFGLYRYRDARRFWNGPPDPLLLPDLDIADADSGCLAKSLAVAFADGVGSAWLLGSQPGDEQRVVLRLGGIEPPDAADPRFWRPSVHAGAIPKAGLTDELAADGYWLFIVSTEAVRGRSVARIELPEFREVTSFTSVLRAAGRAAERLSLPALILGGYPPPVDRSVEWTTITPDPAVIEINMAPDGSALEFLERIRAVHRSAEILSLSPFRLYFNGTVADSGGGGQITLGGPSPGSSPFLVQHRLLPRLIRYVNLHPSLSYLFAHDSIGASGQSVRADERGSDAFRELGLALALLARNQAPTPEILWRSLAPFLTDASGNSHRSELNIEKLWNPFLPGRGQLGLVEFRAFRMQHTPERATALVCLLRAVTGMLMERDFDPPLRHWDSELHERFALPYYLERDLDEIFTDLRDSGLELLQPLPETLRQDEFRELAEFEFEACTVRLRRGLEFWPLVGDTSSQEQGGSRLVDSSTQRLELTLRPRTGREDRLPGCRVRVAGIELPMREERVNGERCKVFGLRYRSFVPWLGLHPTLPASDPIRLVVHHDEVDHAVEAVWHEWRPEGGPYPGLPADLEDSRGRRAERLALRTRPAVDGLSLSEAPDGSLTPWSLDLRWLPPESLEPDTSAAC